MAADVQHVAAGVAAVGGASGTPAMGLVSAGIVGSSLRRPIITGCLKECGFKEQTCVTQCQVCIEQSECRILGKCDPCLREAHAHKMEAEKADQGTLDDGGVSMMRDGMMAEMTHAKLTALDKKRELRTAREGVLKAQREAEWAVHERRAAAMNLIEARQVLRGARLQVTRWKLQNAKKLQDKRAKARQQRMERQKAERKLVAAKKEAAEAENRLEEASADQVNATTIEGEDGPSDSESEDVWKLTKEAEERQAAVERAELDVEKSSSDAQWLDRGLRRRVKSAKNGAKKAREELLVARAHERVAREKLEDAKMRYVNGVQSSQMADKAAQDSEQRLRAAPVRPPEELKVKVQVKKASLTDDDTHEQEKSLRSAAPEAAGATWLPLLALFTMSWL